MPAARQLSITLPGDLAERIERRVESGAYSSVSEAVQEGIELLLDRELSLEEWLRKEVVPSVEEYEADPSTGIPADQIMSRILSRHGVAESDE